jgi:hypothetical protein
VAVDAETLDHLRIHRARAEALAAEFSIALAANSYVFSHEPDGSKPIRPDGMSHRFTKLRTVSASRVGFTTSSLHGHAAPVGDGPPSDAATSRD